MKKGFLVAMVLFSLCARMAFAETASPAPVGLTWHTSAVDLVRKYSAERLRVNKKDSTTLYYIKRAPKKLNDFDSIYGVVHNQHGLVKIILSKDFIRDAYGDEGIKNYLKYKTILSEKYGKAESYEYTGKMTYAGKDEFYQCLAYQGCGGYASFYHGVSIELVGYSRGYGTLKITYVADSMDNIVSEQQQVNDEQAKHAL